MRVLQTILLFVVLLLVNSSTGFALPKNFRNVDTFFAGAMPRVQDMAEFRELGIRTMISLHRVPNDVKKAAHRNGIVIYSFPIRTSFNERYMTEIMRILRESPSLTVYVHCLHGADRTGAIAAYWLYTERHYEPFTSLAAVVSPNEKQWNCMQQLGREYKVSLNIPEHWFGRFSGARNGGLEGLKICGDYWYTRLAHNFLNLALGAPPMDAKEREKNEKYWLRENRRGALKSSRSSRKK